MTAKTSGLIVIPGLNCLGRIASQFLGKLSWSAADKTTCLAFIYVGSVSKNLRHYAKRLAPSIQIKTRQQDNHFPFKSQLLNQFNEPPAKKLHLISRKNLAMSLFNQLHNIAPATD